MTTPEGHARLGIIGAGRLGRRLAAALAEGGAVGAVYNRTAAQLQGLSRARHDSYGQLTSSLEHFVQSLAPPRTILLTISAGSPVDELLAKLRPLLGAGDVIADLGNSHYLDTTRRARALRRAGVLYVGAGVVPTCDDEPLRLVVTAGGHVRAQSVVMTALAPVIARDADEAYCYWAGNDGSGHFVKIAHNGIEYGEMALLAEAYHLLTDHLRLGARQVAAVFADWERGALASSLVSLTSRLVGPDAAVILDEIDDAAEQLGTGRWAAAAALELGAPCTATSEAVFGRALSARRSERRLVADVFGGGRSSRRSRSGITPDDIQNALLAARFIGIAQGHLLLREGAARHGWSFDIPKIVRVWNAGRVLRSEALAAIAKALHNDPATVSTLPLRPSREALQRCQPSWRRVVASAARSGIPLPVLSSTLSFFDAYRAHRLPTRLIQAQRADLSDHAIRRSFPASREWQGSGLG